MIAPDGMNDPKGLIYDIDTFAIHDGPGTRMAVYLKGCPLACAWCHSPESQRYASELIMYRDRCRLCGTCMEVCTQGVHTVDDLHHAIDREACQACGRCVENCPHGALAIKGYLIPASEVVRQAARLKLFFSHSGGGVTVSGGEPTMQPDFVAAVLSGCQDQGIHTAVETSGACNWESMTKVAKHADLVLLDIKLIDPDLHLHWTGIPNQQILENASRLANLNVQVRVPLIPGITDTTDNIRQICSFMQETGLKSIALLPYNASAGAKYEWLDLAYDIRSEPQTEAHLQDLVRITQEAGLACEVV